MTRGMHATLPTGDDQAVARAELLYTAKCLLREARGELALEHFAEFVRATVDYLRAEGEQS